MNWNGKAPSEWLTVYKVNQAYGGPEEGGWWYDVGERIDYVDAAAEELDVKDLIAILMSKHQDLNDPRGKYSVVSKGVIEIVGPSDSPGPERIPESRPVYC